MKHNMWTLSLALLVSSIGYCHGCSCMPAHPQEHYCTSDFVILARVKKEQIIESTGSKVFKVRIRKHFKVSEKGLTALKSGKLHTSLYGPMCGVDLQIGKLYVISGRINSLRANVNVCNMVVEWSFLTKRQRKGLRMVYKKGCDCKVKNCIYGWCKSGSKDNCVWKHECETENGICLRQSHGACMWNKNKLLTSCRSRIEETRRS